MKLKKVLMILIALAVVLTMAGVVSAANQLTDPTKNYNKDIKVNYTVADAYEILIPVDVVFSQQTLSSVQDVNVTKALMAPNKYLHVNLSSPQYDNGFRLVVAGGGESYIPYNITVEKGTSNIQIDENPYTVLTVKAGHRHTKIPTLVKGYGIGDVVALNFSTTDAYINVATQSGDHTDTLTFTFWVDESANS